MAGNGGTLTPGPAVVVDAHDLGSILELFRHGPYFVADLGAEEQRSFDRLVRAVGAAFYEADRARQRLRRQGGSE